MTLRSRQSRRRQSRRRQSRRRQSRRRQSRRRQSRKGASGPPPKRPQAGPPYVDTLQSETAALEASSDSTREKNIADLMKGEDDLMNALSEYDQEPKRSEVHKGISENLAHRWTVEIDDSTGRLYWIDHDMGKTDWVGPTLPLGWDMMVDAREETPDSQQRLFFIDHNKNSTTWRDPRLSY